MKREVKQKCTLCLHNFFTELSATVLYCTCGILPRCAVPLTNRVGNGASKNSEAFLGGKESGLAKTIGLVWSHVPTEKLQRAETPPTLQFLVDFSSG